MEVRMTITGNADDPRGSPLAKIRKTGNQTFTETVKRYVRWKNYVLGEFHKQTGVKEMVVFDKHGNARIAKPLVTSEECPGHMHIKIEWMNGVHADPEGVFGSIADALFSQDKYLSGSFEADSVPKGQGKIEIIINI